MTEMIRVRAAVLVLALVTAILPVQGQEAEDPSAQPFTELKGCTLLPNQANDGDSFHVHTPDGKEHIFRLYFVDCPEDRSDFPDRVAEQAAYFGINSQRAVQIGLDAARFTSHRLTGTFTVYTRWKDALGKSELQRFYAFIKIGPDYLQDLLVQNGLARIYGVRTPLPDGKDSRVYLAHLAALEQEAKGKKLGGWGGGAVSAAPKPKPSSFDEFFHKKAASQQPVASPVASPATSPAVVPTTTPALKPVAPAPTPAVTGAALQPAPSVAAAASDVKVWVNTKSGIYSMPGQRYYGKTAEGKYMTEAEAVKAGYRPSKN